MTHNFESPHYKKVSRLLDVPGIGVERMGSAADAAHDPEMLRLENLDTDQLPPEIAIKATQTAAALDQNNSYLPFLGQNELREAAAKRVERVSGITYDWQKQCIITAGGMSGILNCFLAMIEPGDEVIVTDPVYAGIVNRIRLAGGIVFFVPLIPTPQGWRLDAQALQKSVTLKTKMIVISPGMPHGHVLTQEEWQAVADVCTQRNLWLLYDAAMERILYDNRKVIHPASFPGMAERTITVGAASKELRMIGWRVGWVVGPHEIINDIGLVSIANVVCQVGIAMPGVAAALNAPDDGLHNALKVWQERRDTLLEEMKGLPVVPPHGGWSLLLNTQKLGYSPAQASELLFKKAKIAATPMNGWGKQAEQYLRFVFSNESKERIIGVGQKIKKALNI